MEEINKREEGINKGEEEINKREEGINKGEEEINKREEDINLNINITNDCINLKHLFMNCVEEDNKSNKEFRPATRKLDNLDLFIRTLLNKKYQEYLLDENILGVVKNWLEPLPDKSLPNISIRKRLLETLRVMNVDKSHLQESGIGKIIHFYSLNPKENLEIKRIALEIIQRWTRKIIIE